MGTGKSLGFLSRVSALNDVGFWKMDPTVVCRVDEGKSLRTGLCQEAVRVVLASFYEEMS